MENDNSRLYSILSYVGPLFLIGMLAGGDNPKIKFHVNQGLVLFCAGIALSIAAFIVGLIWSFLGSLVSLVGWVAYLVLAIMGILNANNEVENELPFIGGIHLYK